MLSMSDAASLRLRFRRTPFAVASSRLVHTCFGYCLLLSCWWRIDMAHLIGRMPATMYANHFIVLLHSKCVFDEMDGWGRSFKKQTIWMK